MNVGCSIGIFLNSANLICRSVDISKCFRGSPHLRDNESRLYIFFLFLTAYVFYVLRKQFGPWPSFCHFFFFGHGKIIWAMGFFSWAMAGKVTMREKNCAHGKNGKMLMNVHFLLKCT